MNNKFICIEGIDGSAKTTQTKLLVEALANNGIYCWQTAEPTNGPIGKLIRSQYLTGKRKVDSQVLSLLFAADRVEHLTSEDGVDNHLARGDMVVCDRCVLSSLVYDTYEYLGTEYFESELYNAVKLNMTGVFDVRPDLTIFIDVDPVTALSRITSNRNETSIYETADKLKVLAKTYARAVDFLKNEFQWNIVRVDGNHTIDDVHYLIWDSVSELLRLGNT